MNQDEMRIHAHDLSYHIVDSIQRHPDDVSSNTDNLAETLVEVYQIGMKEAEAEQPAAPEVGTADQIEKTKHILLSKTFWGTVLSGAAYLAPKLGLHIGTV